MKRSPPFEGCMGEAPASHLCAATRLCLTFLLMCMLGNNHLPGQPFCTRPFQLDTVNWGGNYPLLRFFDPSGKEYTPDDLMMPNGMVTDCQAGIFHLVFDDLSAPFFFDPTPFNGLTMGEIRRNASCQVFQDISDFLINNAQANGQPGVMGRVNINITADNPPNGAAMYCRPIFCFPTAPLPPPTATNLVLDTEVHKTILSGENSYLQYPLNLVYGGTLNANSFHARIEVSPTHVWYYDFDNNTPPISAVHGDIDYYTAMLHEALHAMGIIEFASPVLSAPPAVHFSRYESFLRYNDAAHTPLIFQNPPSSGNWTASTAPPINTACASPDAVNYEGFAVALQQTAQLFSTSLVLNFTAGKQHLSCTPINPITGECTATQPSGNDFVMAACTGAGPDFVKRHPNETEKDILCDLGYGFEAWGPNGEPVFVDNRPFDPFRHHVYAQSCEPVCDVVAISDLYELFGGMPEEIFPLANDINGSNAILTQLVLHTQGAGWISGQTGSSFTFQPNGNYAGWVVLSYVPVCNGTDYSGGTAFIFINLNNCDCPPNATVYQAGAPGTTTDLSTTALMPSVPPGSCVHIEGTLDIDVPYAFPPGVRLIMGAGSRIDANKNLSFSPQSNLYACDQMWQGIHVWKGATLQMEGVLVEDADDALWAHNNAIMSLTDNRFHANHVGLRFEDNGGTTPLSTTFLAMDNNLFDCTGTTLLPPYAPNTLSRAGILNWQHSLTLNRPQHFRDMRNGIISSNGDLFVRASTFRHIRHNTNPAIEGLGISATNPAVSPRGLSVTGDNDPQSMEFEDCRVGILGNVTRTTITSCGMEGVGTGISISMGIFQVHRIALNRINCSISGIEFLNNSPVQSCLINDNYINAGTPASVASVGINIAEVVGQANAQQSITIGNNVVEMQRAFVGFQALNVGGVTFANNAALLHSAQPPANEGFNANNCGGLTLTCNHAVGSQTATGQRGFRVVLSPGARFQCNRSDNTLTGMSFENFPLGGSAVIRGNEMGTHATGLNYTNVNGLQQFLQGNTWTGTYTNAGAVLGASPSTGNEFFTDAFGTVHCPPSVIVNGTAYPSPNPWLNQQWFIYANGTAFECEDNGIVCSSAMSGLFSRGINPEDYALINGSVNYESYELESEWAARRDLYNRILHDNALLSDSLLAAFYDTYQNESEGRFEALNFQVGESFRLQPLTQEQLELLGSQLTAWGDSLLVLDSLLQDTQDSSTYLPLIRNAQGLRGGLQSQYELVMQGLNTLRNNTYQYVQTENGLLPSTEIYEENEQRLNEIYLSTLALGNTDFTQQQLADLEVIAKQCPLSGGAAVYGARALYYLVDKFNDYDDGTLCTQAGLQYRKPKASENELPYRLYPNPASNTLRISRTGGMEQTSLRLEIRDMYGKTVLGQTLPGLQAGWEIQTGSLPAGIYTATIRHGGLGILHTEKLIIVR